jgi:hypothetical protein
VVTRRVPRPGRKLTIIVAAVLVVLIVLTASMGTISRQRALPDIAVAITGVIPRQSAAPDAGRPLVVQLARGLKELSQHCGGVSLLRASEMVRHGLQELRKGGDTNETDLSLLNAYNLALRANGGKWGTSCTRVTSTLITLTLQPNG